MKKYHVFLLTLALFFALSGCGQKSTSTWQDYYNLGVRYLSEGNYEEAIIAFTAAIEIDPKQADAYEGRGDAYVGLASTLTDEAEIAAQYANAEADYLTAIELDGQSAELYGKLGTVYIALGDTDAAVAILEQGYAATGDESLKTEADSLSAASETDDALEEDQSAEAAAAAVEESELGPTWQDYYDLGSAYLDAGDYEAAIEAFTEAISLDPGHAEAYVGRGDAYVAMAEALDPETQAEEIAELYALAEADYLKALELDDSLTEIYTKLANLYLAMETEDAAIEILDEAYESTGNKEFLKEIHSMGGYAGNDLVVWTDDIFEQMVRGAIGISDGPVYVRDLDYIWQIEILGNTHIFLNDESANVAGVYWGYCGQEMDGSLLFYYSVVPSNLSVRTSEDYTYYTERGNITNVETLRYFRNLLSIAIIANHITDVSVLDEMDKIKWANFFANDISNTGVLVDINGDFKRNNQFVEIGDVLPLYE